MSNREDVRNDIHEFLTSRRARITPELAGLPAYGAKRRVSGLRREEVALLAGISSSTTRGSNAGSPAASPRACWRESLAPFSSTRRAHLIDLVRIANTTRPRW